jgi:hypothetical protein
MEGMETGRSRYGTILLGSGRGGVKYLKVFSSKNSRATTCCCCNTIGGVSL